MKNSNHTSNSTTIIAYIYMAIAIFQAVFRTLHTVYINLVPETPAGRQLTGRCITAMPGNREPLSPD